MLSFKNAREIIILTIPVFLGNLSHTLINAGDAFVASMYSTEALAALGVSYGFLLPVIYAGIGAQSSISVLMSRHRNDQQIRRELFPISLIFSFIIAIIIISLGILLTSQLKHFPINPRITEQVEDYLYIMYFSSFFVFGVQAVKEYLLGIEDVRFANIVALICVFLNVGLNFLFCLKGVELPLLGNIQGVKGLGIASVISRMFFFLSLFFYAIRKYKLNFSFSRELWNLKIKKLSHIGLPIGFSYFLESLGFCILGVFVARFELDQSAAHHIAFQYAGFFFMLPISIASVMSVKVSYHYGLGEFLEVSNYLKTSYKLIFLWALIVMVLLILIPDVFIGVFTQSVDVIAIASSLLVCVGAFQIVDSTQVFFSNILRAIGRTKIVPYSIIVAFWIVGLPVGLFLDFSFQLKAMGYWLGLTLGLFLNAVFLGTYLWKGYKHRLLGTNLVA